MTDQDVIDALQAAVAAAWRLEDSAHKRRTLETLYQQLAVMTGKPL